MITRVVSFVKDSAAATSAAVDLLNQGEIVALPTETVYGLAGVATDVKAVAKIFAAKNRPDFDPPDRPPAGGGSAARIYAYRR